MRFHGGGKRNKMLSMKLELTEQARIYLKKVVSAWNGSLAASDAWNAYLEDPDPQEADALALLRKEGYQEKDAFPEFFRRRGYLEEGDFSAFRRAFALGEPKELSPKVYRANPYARLLKGVRGKKGDSSLGEKRYRPYEAFLYDEVRGDPEGAYREISPFGYFKEGFSCPAISSGGTVWMSLIPHEIHTMRKPIEEAHGRVLCLGLGLGYYPYMVGEKKEVSSVDVVEWDKDVLGLFSSEIFPRFPHSEKYRFLEGDAFSFLKKQAKEGDYDFIFADLWHNAEDGLPLYLALKKLEGEKNLSMSYWIEESILTYLRRFVVLLLQEAEEGKGEEDYPHGEFLDETMRGLYLLSKETALRTKEDIRLFLSDANLRGLAKRLSEAKN